MIRQWLQIDASSANEFKIRYFLWKSKQFQVKLMPSFFKINFYFCALPTRNDSNDIRNFWPNFKPRQHRPTSY